MLRQDRILELMAAFQAAAVEEEGVEFWLARDLALLLGYEQYQNFKRPLDRARIACENAGVTVADHFLEVVREVPLGSGARREVPDVMLTRYAAYLVAQNASSEKEEVAFAQTYFAAMTRQAEQLQQLLLERERWQVRQELSEVEKRLSEVIYERSASESSFARIRSRGDFRLFGGLSTQQMKDRIGVPEKRPLADFLPTVTIRAKSLAGEMTFHNSQAKDLQGEDSLAKEHEENNAAVREMLISRGIQPELLPAEEDIQKARRRIESTERKLGSKKKGKPK